MSVDPIDALLRKPLREQLDTLVKTWAMGDPPPGMSWLSHGTAHTLAQALMMRILVESSHRVEGLTRWLVWLTVVLGVLTAVLVYDVARRLIGV